MSVKNKMFSFWILRMVQPFSWADEPTISGKDMETDKACSEASHFLLSYRPGWRRGLLLFLLLLLLRASLSQLSLTHFFSFFSWFFLWCTSEVHGSFTIVSFFVQVHSSRPILSLFCSGLLCAHVKFFSKLWCCEKLKDRKKKKTAVCWARSSLTKWSWHDHQAKNKMSPTMEDWSRPV